MEGETAMKGPTGEQPEESLFDRAKRRIAESIKYLSCSSRRGRKRAKYLEIRGDDSISKGSIKSWLKTFENFGDALNPTENVENWLKTFENFDDTWFSTHRFDNWPKIIEYFGDSNMIDCLPKEMLGHVASFLRPKYFNSLVRTNKATRSRLSNRDRQPLHINMSITYEYDDEEMDLSRIEADISLQPVKRCGNVFGLAIEELNVSMGTAEERMKIVADWFYTKSIGEYHESRRKYYSNIKELLHVHLQFLRHHNVIIDKLELVEANELEVVDLTIFFKENRMRVEELTLDMEVLGDHHLDLIHVCRPTSLSVVNAFVPSIFHEDNVVRKLNRINVKKAYVEMKERDLEKYYSTKSLTMFHIRGATVQDVNRFLYHWIDRKLIGFKCLKVACEDAEATGNRILNQLDRQVVDVERFPAWSSPGGARFSLRCLADNRDMHFGWDVGAGRPSALYILCNTTC